MRIDQLDSNMKIESSTQKEGLKWLDIREAPFEIYGLNEPKDKSKPFHRIPIEVAESTKNYIHVLNLQTAGGRVRFSTDSPYIALYCETNEPVMPMSHMPLSGSQGFDLYIDDGNTSKFVKTFLPPPSDGYTKFDNVIDLPYVDGNMHYYTVNFPLYGTAKNVYIGLKDGSRIEAGKKYRDIKKVVYYGSSITQGGCTSHPGNCYQGFIVAKNNVDYLNIGLSGSAKGEEEIARYIAELDMSIFVCDYDYNAQSLDELISTHMRMYNIFREKHPKTPYVFITAPECVYGRGRALRRNALFDFYNKLRHQGDSEVYFIDGERLFDGDASCDCTVDGTHPNDLGFYRMARGIEKVLNPILDRIERESAK